jgi:hypothetical protein
MKNIHLVLGLSMAILSAASHQTVLADEDERKKSVKVQTADFSELASRVIEINSMDRSLMSRSEKKELKKELRQIKSELNDIGKANKTNDGSTKIYISLGSLLLIILILVIIL